MNSYQPKKRAYKKSGYVPRKRYPVRKAAAYSLTKMPSANEIHKFTRWVPEQILDEAKTDVLVGHKFQLNQLDSVTDFTNLFQEYMITKVEFFIYPKMNVVTPSTIAVQGTTSLFFIAFDPNDNVSPSTLAEIRQMAGCKVFYGLNPIKFTCYPRLQMKLTAAGATGVGTSGTKQWVSTDNADADYFGVKTGMPGNDNTSSFFNTYSFNVRYTICCRRFK